MQQLDQNNLFTAFNNIEEIKKEKGLKQMIRVEEMIKVIKETYNYNAPMLASILKTGTQSVYNRENGSRPSVRHFNKIKELYDEIVSKDEANAPEQPEIANKEVAEDVTAGTPFIKLTFDINGKERYININNIHEIAENQNATCISFSEEDYTNVKESITEVLELIRKKIKENEKN